LPEGLTLNSDGAITGTPFSESTNNFVVQVYDSLGAGSDTSLNIISTRLPVLDLPVKVGANQFSFRVTAAAGQSYTAEYSSDLTNWNELYITNAPGDVFFILDSRAIDNRFYRLKVN